MKPFKEEEEVGIDASEEIPKKSKKLKKKPDNTLYVNFYQINVGKTASYLLS
jgi:hypothetical protein